MTLTDYKKALSAHDWTYAFSDDHNVWQRGRHAEAQLMSQAAAGGPQFKRAFNERYALEFHREPFCKPYTFPFPEAAF